MQDKRLGSLLFAVLLSLVRPLDADPLNVGRPMPDGRLLHIVDGEVQRLATFAEVIQDKTIVFVFASW